MKLLEAPGNDDDTAAPGVTLLVALIDKEALVVLLDPIPGHRDTEDC